MSKAVFKSLLYRRRFNQIERATSLLQLWARARRERKRYLNTLKAVKKLQKTARGHSARTGFREYCTLLMIAEEARRMQNVREREMLYLKKVIVELCDRWL